MDKRQKIDEIVESAQQKFQDEIGGLIGASFSLKQTRKEIVSGRNLLEKLAGRQILTTLEISGDISGTGYLLLTVKDAIRLGGTLIMLPSSELEELVESESYDEETEDSYGEIGNIIAGIYTNLFEEMHDPPCSFQRAGHSLVDLPIIDEDAELPLAEAHFYQVASDVTLDGKELGTLIQLFPAVSFGLLDDVQEPKSLTQSAEGETEDSEQDAGDESLTETHSKDNTALEEQTETPNREDPQASESSELKGVSSGFDVEGRKNDIDSILEICRVNVQQEVADAVGVDVTLSEMNNKVVSKEQFYLEEASGKQVAATLDAEGDFEGSCYIYLGMKHAIRIGCTLLMLPAGELESAVSENTFNPDVQDAYEEIITVISRVYEEVLTQNYDKKVHFLKRDIDQVMPMKVDIESSDPIVNQTYYLNTTKIALNGKDCGHLQLLFPTEFFGLETLQSMETGHFPEEATESLQTPLSSGGGSVQGGGSKTVHGADKSKNGTAKVLIISDADPEAERIYQILDSQGIEADQLNFRDNVTDYLPGAFQAVLLVMKDVDEQSLGMAIKISTSCSLPLIAAGYSWTRSKVFKAIKYGVSDIILAPATEEDVSKKITCLITSLAA